MSFLFGKSKKHQYAALPAATRDITSSHGQGSLIPTTNGLGGRDPEKARGGPPTQTPTPGSSVNNSLNSLQGPGNTSSPEPKTLRERSDSELHNSRAAGPNQRGPQDSPYPWSQRRLNFTTTANPFPRYGAAVNSTASKDGVIYIMGGLINGSTVKGDLWMVEVGSGTMACYPISTTGDGPGPRVGHASLLVGNAFIVFGGDTKLDDGDMLDDTLYLLNTSTKHWSRAMPAGPRPSGRYGHTLNILGSKIYIFGGQVEGFFFNDLVAFDLNSLQSATSRWEVLIPNSKEGTVTPQGPSPPARTNHSIVTWNEKLYLFGGTDGINWFNDVWTYDPRTNSWTELDCIGYIPVAREGHAAALVNDTMYIFGGRTREGVDLGDLAAFRISSRRWYMFQNMGLSPSARSGHSMTAFGKHVVVLAGEPSSAPSDRGELSLAYILDTSKIRYPANESQPPMSQQLPAPRKMSGGDRSGIPQSKLTGPAARESVMGGQQPMRGPEQPIVNGAGPPGSRLPRAAGSQAPSGPPPMQQAPQPRTNGVVQGQYNNGRSKTPTKGERGFGPPVDTTRTPSLDRDNVSPSTKENEMSMNEKAMNGSRKSSEQSPVSQSQSYHKESMDTTRSGSVVSRNTSRSHRQQHSLESIDHSTPRRSLEAQQRVLSREAEHRPVDSGVGSSPALSQQNDELVRELEAARNRNAWYASELALARKAGYHPNASASPILDERAADVFGDDDRPLLEALLKMRAELAKVQGSIESQAVSAANKIAEIEKQRDAAIGEAVYAKTKLAAHGGSQAGTPQPDGSRGTGTPELDRMNEINRRLAASLAAQTELSSKLEKLSFEVEAERKARKFAEETAEAAQKRVSELDSYRQRSASEVESLRAELHEAQRIAREESANSSEARASSRLLAVDKNELSSKLAKVLEEAKNHAAVLESLREAVSASSDKASLLERKLEDERRQRDSLEQKLIQLKAEHEDRTTELESISRRLRDTEELAEKHAAEARTHRQAVLSGLSRATDIDDDEHEAADERVTILQQQVEASNAMVRKNQEAADLASEKLRRAEERIAGLEAYQEQASREGLSIRKQLQQALRDMQSTQAEKAELHQQYERHQLESNALEVQLKTLKNLLEERGVNAVDARRSRVLDSPGSRFGTPELNRVRELEQQLDASIKAHDEIRSTFEQREHEVSKEWEEKLTALHNDHQAAVKYLRGTEKMLTKMKQELERYKGANMKLEDELAQARQAARSPQPPSGWESERESLQNEISSMQASLKTSVTRLESQLSNLRTELATVCKERDSAAEHADQIESSMQQSRADLEAMRHQNELLEERARDAEQRVQMFLDQFESSVDNYRRQSQVPVGAGHGGINGNHSHLRNHHDSISGDSIYTDGDGDGDVTPDAAAAAAAAATRNSVALDNLATELDALRSHWETTNKAYRLSDRFDFERTPTSEKSELSDSLAAWRKRMDLEDDEHDDHDRQQGRKGSFSQASGAPANGVGSANSAGMGPGGSAMI
ncbi:cell polarity protein-like protein [Glonium stellatum]|uniref:Cell polarity protein-like protein n=1 Tax=Glonium stellatum TaxID=574774 RepID=A0A8E2F0D7_9PEZI|nr:cell polarity protein-like protein [Glonium stellatum]